MKVLVLHGPAITSSRKKLIEIKQKYDPTSVVTFEEGSDPKDILAALQTVSMFETDRLVIAENPPDDFILPYTLYPIPYTLVLWYDHQLQKIPQSAQAFFFPESKEISVFPFLDKLGMKDQGAYLQLDKLKKAGFDSQYLITMIFYLLRNLVADPKNAKDFVKNKNVRMRKNFSPTDLINLYKFVLETDFKIKSGLMEETQAEFSLVEGFAG